MTWRLYLLLAFLGLATVSLVAFFQSSPGYMDADYYYVGGMRLVDGFGFTEPYLWNFLDDPLGLPHASHGYWMPLASILAAASAALLGSTSWCSARAVFLLIAGLIPPVTAALAWSFTSRRDLAITSGLLAVFPVYYLSYLPVTDNFGLYMLFGGLFFLIINRKFSNLNPFLLGLLSGLMHLTRADGLLWLLVAFLADLFVLSKPPQHRFRYISSFLLLTLVGYLLVMTPWFLRNYTVFGTPLAPGGSSLLWLTSYDQVFSYPASQLSFSAWWQSGILAILKVRFWSLGLNLSNMLLVQGEVFLFPLIGIGIWQLRKDPRLKLACLAWLMTFLSMTFVFPFVGARGGFFHSGASVQTVWWALAPVGLDQVIAWGSRKRGWKMAEAGRVFQATLVVFAALLTTFIFYHKVIGSNSFEGWGKENIAYRHISTILVSRGMTDGTVVMVANPPGFYLASGNPSIAVPDGDLNTLLSVAYRYGAKYVILEQGGVPVRLTSVYDHPAEQPGLLYLGDSGGTRLYAIQP
jgi:hypothetical protein